MSYKVTLYREVRGRVRYYTLSLYPTLFNEYLLIREYGGVKNRKPTRVIKKYFSSFSEAVSAIEEIVVSKGKKGYRI